ncbi:MAG TPA: ECF-type sigma factor [Steroidobacteraceae bacterium]|nr:ECF-type sigma factor [Steroidobacteraceae bacterium]
MADMDFAALVSSAGTATGEERAKLFAAMYAELHRVAQRELKRNAALTLSPTTLLHETFLSVSQGAGAVFANRARFMAYAARAMRGLLIDYVRNRQAQKRGGGFEITTLDADEPAAAQDLELGALGEALESLAQVDPRLAECVDLKFFCGFSHAEIADMWQVSERTVRRDWDKARILLNRLLGQHGVD